MIFENSIRTQVAFVPPQLQDHIFQFTTCELEEYEINAMQIVLMLLSDYQERQPFPAGAVCNVVYTTQDSITFSLSESEKDILGAAPHIVCLYMQRIREVAQGRWQSLLPIFLEELCHSLYQEKNEYRVKYLVRDILGQKFPIKLHEMYPKMFDENDQPILCEGLESDFA